MSESIVWILGAGFSRPLGGPLLGDLFSEASAGNLRARFPPERYPRLKTPAADLVRWIYRWGLGEEQSLPWAGAGKVRGERLWTNAEEYLEFLDTAVDLGSESPGWRRLSAVIRVYEGGTNPGARASFDGLNQRQHIADTARRLLAAEVTAFLPDATMPPPALERWKPYQTWWRNVSPGDTIVTFNYDLVLEHLAKNDSGRMFVVPPGHDAPLPAGAVRVLKLHGSVDWRRLPGTGVPDRYETGVKEDFAITCDDYELAIASPGLTKQRMVKEAFSALWRHAESAIGKAGAIVFVGYRFPPSDSEALERLLGAIGSNSELYLALHTVLGPNRGEDEKRLHSLLRHAMRNGSREHTSAIGHEALKGIGEGGRRYCTLVSHGLWAQDFALVGKPHEIRQPYFIRWE